MIPDAVLSCSYLLLGSGCCIYRLVNYSFKQFSKALPEYILASIAIDPILIEQELLNKKENKNLTDWCLNTVGLSSIIYSLYLHYNCIITGNVLVSSLILLEIITCIKDELSIRSEYQNSIDNFLTRTNINSLVSYFDTKYLSCLWIFTTGVFGLAVNNNYICMANIPYSLTMIVYRPFGLSREWSIRNSMNDYMMLIYIILLTEALIQSK
ncbi:hypothetical protein PV325_006855 [Microctonus aethiopoides]|uniref:Uncharacterized protein n=1 Tax=Microctonus aethiopoides TaxID=144406 RepID=A0AA39EYH4_9HYME|nr:hypothetical protein PV325_006855 [Microctonus aethiopoides]KAK0098431.1 hypothetical protein PV326_008534 [Microctonus aethiopoides]KAK0159254.1 hypothetical protein PV328_010152 [Microctonus aethiopoides]